MVLNSEWAQVEVIDLINDGSGLAFGIVGGRSTGVVVKSILPGGIADRDSRLQSGDHILQIGGINLRGLGSEQVASILRQCGVHVRIMVARAIDTTLPNYQLPHNKLTRNAAIVPTKLLVDPDELERYLIGKGYASFYQQNGFSSNVPSNDQTSDLSLHLCSGFVDVVKSSKSAITNPIVPHNGKLVSSPTATVPETEYYTVRLQKNDLGLGITVAGYVCEKEEISGIFVKSITKNSAADLCKRIKINDRIVKVDDVSLIGLSNQTAINLLKVSGQVMTLSFERFLRGPKYEQLQEIIRANELCYSSPISTTPTPTTLTSSKNNNKIQYLSPRRVGNFRQRSSNLVKAKSESSLTLMSYREQYLKKSDVNIRFRSLEVLRGFPMWRENGVTIELNKGQHGLGFSVLDYQDPLNPYQSVIVIRSLVPGGVAQTDGRLKPGDRLLAVNDVNLKNSILERAVQVLKSAPRGPVNITVAKPIPSTDTSFSSQDTEDEGTYLDEFQECLDDCQDLIGVEICLDEDNSFTHSSYDSTIEDVCERDDESRDFLNQININECANSDEFNKTAVQTDKFYSDALKCNRSKEYCFLDDTFNFRANQKTTQLCLVNNLTVTKIVHRNVLPVSETERISSISPQPEDTDDKEGYDTCIDDSTSDDIKKQSTNNMNSSTDPGLNPYVNNRNNNILVQERIEDDLNCYNEALNAFGSDDFFLMEFIDEDKPLISNNTYTHKYKSEPTLNQFSWFRENKNRKHIKINEYYNDYADCLDAYFLHSKSNNNDNNLIQEPKDDSNSNSKDSTGNIYIENISDDFFNSKLTIKHKFKSASSTHCSCNGKYEKEIHQRRHSLQTISPKQLIFFKTSSILAYISQQISLTRRPLPKTVTGSNEVISEHLMRERPEEMLEKHWGPSRHVKVFRENNQSLGISIVGGKVDLNASQESENSVMGIFIKNVVPNSPAGRTGEFKTGDRILEVSGIDLRRASHEKAIETIKNAPNPLTFVLQSLVPLRGNRNENTYINYEEQNNRLESTTKPKKSVKYKDRTNEEKSTTGRESVRQRASGSFKNRVTDLKSSMKKRDRPETNNNVTGTTSEVNTTTTNNNKVESGSDSEDEEDVRELEGRTVSAKGQEIDRASAANIKRTKEEIAADTEEEDDFGYTTKKVLKKYANLGHKVLMVQLERSQQGLGISLAGHKNRSCMAVFVCGLNPSGAAFRTGEIQVGDEILEVNGTVLHGRCHLNASAIIKGLSGPIFKILVLRRKQAVEDIAVRPITQFPVTLEDETPEEKYANFPNIRVISIKKGTQSLGIMIIEGKHSDVGQGIFISDIQEGSAAEKAGLEIGEMILAVNKDTLVGSNYNAAATLLKQTEGVVTLVVSNPSKKEDGASKGNAEDAAKQKPAEPEPPADPATCPIKPGKEVTIEINSENKALGLSFVGGTDTQVTNAIVLVDVYKGGAAAKDARLQPGDQILDVNGTPLKDVTHIGASQILRQILPKVKLIVYRPETVEYTTVDVELAKKPGKGLGLSVTAREAAKGVYITEILCGGLADTDGKIAKGDLIASINDHNLENASAEEAAAVLKAGLGKTVLKLHRYKPKAC